MAPIKLINIGDTGTGKTGALASLAAAGYNVRVIDLDNGMEAVINLMTDPKSKYPPEAVDRIRWRTVTEPMRVLNGIIAPKNATVWQTAMTMLETWKGDRRYDRETKQIVQTTDGLGNLGTWGPNDILVIDTLSTLGTAAMNFFLVLNGDLFKKRTSMEQMRDIGATQTMLDKLLQLVFDESVQCHVIINTHVVFAKEDGSNIEPGYEGLRYAFPAAIGKAMSTKIGKYFNHMLMTRKEGTQQKIYTRGLANVGLKSGAPLRVAASYGVENGLAEYFKAVLQEEPSKQSAPPRAAAPSK